MPDKKGSGNINERFLLLNNKFLRAARVDEEVLEGSMIKAKSSRGSFFGWRNVNDGVKLPKGAIKCELVHIQEVAKCLSRCLEELRTPKANKLPCIYEMSKDPPGSWEDILGYVS